MSKTSIILKHPYDQVWEKGYLNINSEGRRTLSLYNNSQDRSSTQYARYLMSVELGRFLRFNEQVDHIDEDKTNDDISNLQILTPLANTRKSHIVDKIKCICPVCFKKFLSTKQRLYKKTNSTKCCSRKCGGIYSHIIKRASNSTEE